MIRLIQGCQTGDQIKLTLFVRFKTKLIRPNPNVTFTFHGFNMDKFRQHISGIFFNKDVLGRRYAGAALSTRVTAVTLALWHWTGCRQEKV